ncbi:MAG TPA: hypothetical protein VFW96_08260 [Thermomicrobiales bacterium]|nr:hypothetical protein [Thermomicrobiales bacterium]
MSGSVYRYQVHVGRVVVRGAANLSAAELRALVAQAVAREVGRATLPAGRTMHASVRIDAAARGLSLTSGAPGIAAAVASGVAGALGGGTAHG